MAVERENQRFLGVQIVGGQRRASRLYGLVTDAEARPRGHLEPEDLEDTEPGAVRDAVVRMASHVRLPPNDVLVSVGIVIGGIVVREKLVKQAPAFGDSWKNQRIVFDLEEQLHSRFGNETRVVAVNDANALAVHEQFFPGGDGELADKNNFAVVLLAESGIGCGLILAESLYTGGRGSAGELGHIKAAGDDVVCECGRSGCLESVATVSRMAQREAAGTDVSTVRAEGGRALGLGLSALINLVNPEAILIYGQDATTGAAQAFHIGTADRFDDNPYLHALVTEIREHVPADAASECRIVIRTEKDLPGPRAAVSVAMRAYRERLTR